ncbi:MAG: T9SS type A sorting domain-containing protein, partial [Lentimicrobiaceae bacterium]|nr:T9SS type A sorting domain-containing protein [Lentimicrobiaceae bacterium]
GEEEKGKGAKARRHEGNGRISPSNFEGVPEGRGSLYENLRFLFEYRNHYTDNLSITETYLAENNYEEALATLANMYNQFEVAEEQLLELKGMETYTRWLQQLENERKNIYELSDKELDYLANYVETNTGRGSVFAHNILCALYGICPEEVGGERYEIGGDEDEISRYTRNDGEKSPSNFEGVPEGRGSLYENITIYPNPTTGELEIRNYELGTAAPLGASSAKLIKSVEVFDVYGRKVSSHHLIASSSNHLINISHLQAGIYFVKITTKAGDVVKKIIKQ